MLLPQFIAFLSRVPHPQTTGSSLFKVGTTAATLLTSAIQHLAPPTAHILIATLWQGIALAAITALCLRFAPRTSATLRFSLWAAALLLVCLLPLTIALPAATHSAPLFRADPRWSLALAAIWLILSLYRAADLTRHALRLRSLSRQATPVTVDLALAALLHSHRQAQLCTSTLLDRPGVIGFFAPRILIPAWLFDQLTTPELKQIVLHELEHLRRHDDWLNLFQKLSLVAFPLNPALHWIERRLCLERELACDEGVVRRTHAPRLYATCLARLAEHALDHRTLSLTLGFLERQSELARRVTGILRTPHRLSSRQSLALTGTVATLLLCGSAELARCPQLISFTAASSLLAVNSQVPDLAPGAWTAPPSTTRILYIDAAVPHLLRTALPVLPKPIHKRTKTRKVRQPVPAQRAALKPLDPTAVPNTFTADLTPPAQAAPPQPTPTLVHYTLVRVEGGWLILQL